MIIVNGMDFTSGVFTVIGLYYTLALACYFLLSYALYRMATKKGIAKAKYAFIPFYRYVVAGKIIGKCVIFGKITDKIGLIVMIMRAVTIALNTFLVIYSNYLIACAIGENLIISVASDSSIYIDGVALSTLQETYYAKGLQVVATIVGILSSIADLIWIFIAFAFWNSLLSKYKPAMAFMYVFIAVAISLLTESFLLPLEIGGLFAFIFRNREEIKINVVYRAPYNSYQGNNYQPRDPYGRDNGNYNQAPQGGDPFEEFSSDKSNDDPFKLN